MKKHWSASIAVVAVALFGATACEPAPPAPTTPPPARRSVVVVGDSITAGAGAELAAAFNARNWASSINSIGGTQVFQRRDEIRNVANGIRPDVIVVSLGTNDMGNVEMRPQADWFNWYNWSLANTRGAMDDMAGTPCVVWININDWTRFSTAGGEYDLLTWGPHYNNVLRDEDAARANLHVADFRNAVVGNGLPWMDVNMDDHVLHFNPGPGNEWLANWIAGQVRSHCGI